MADDLTKAPEETKKSNLWIIIVLLALFSGLVPMIIAVNLVKLKRNKSYSKFDDKDYRNAIMYWIAVLVPAIIFDFLLGFGFTLVIFLLTAIVTWLLTKDIGKAGVNLSPASTRNRLLIVIISFLVLTGISVYLLYISGGVVKGSYIPFPVLSNKGIFKGNYSYSSNIQCENKQVGFNTTRVCFEGLWTNATNGLPTPIIIIYYVFPNPEAAQASFNADIPHADPHAWITPVPADTLYVTNRTNNGTGDLFAFLLYDNTRIISISYSIHPNDTNSSINAYKTFIAKALPSIINDINVSENYTSNYNYSSSNHA